MSKTIIGVVIAVVVVVAGVMLMNNSATAPTSENAQTQDQPQTQNSDTSSNQPAEPAAPAEAAKTYDISMTDEAYVPAALTIKKGDAVRFTNNGTKPNWPASAPHPTHTDYPEFDPKKVIAVGESWSFTFEKAGTWRFHDHVNPTRFGSITVQ